MGREPGRLGQVEELARGNGGGCEHGTMCVIVTDTDRHSERQSRRPTR
jgi:hypothetical protein